jgi:phenylalanyl-tRNA synthetase beta chain
MKFTLGWLKDHLETDADAIAVGERLTAIGLELEGLEDRTRQYEAFRVAYVEKAEKHPDADRLRVCVVDTGKEKLQVVCGAPNARTGMKAVFAPAGSFIPGTGAQLKKGTIRGQESNGMLVSEREMAVSEEGEGIIDVPADVPVGTPFAELFGLTDPVLEINVTPNRADCAGVRGIARDLAASGLGTLRPLDESAVPGGFRSPVGVRLDFAAGEEGACPLFLGRYIRGVKNGPSPEWLQRRLKAIGLRPISALVDITNYLSYDLCRPLHVFDADKVKGDIHVRLARKGETLEALNDKTYELEDFMTVVCDESGVLGLGGVIGGSATGCSEETVNVYVECAYFDPLRTARTGRALQVNSDARYRFERGVDPVFTVPAMEIATRLIMDLCGGAPGEVVTAGSVPFAPRAIAFDPAYTKQLAGLDLPEARQKEILENLGFAVAEDKVAPPPWRGDVEGRADLVEEIARIEGYDKIAPKVMPRLRAVTAPGETVLGQRARLARTALAARGMNECVTWSFMPSGVAEKFGAQDGQAAQALRLVNPISSGLDQMRPSLLPNLIEAAQKNAARGFADTALFEVGPAFRNGRPDGQATVAAGIRAGHANPRHWSISGAPRAADAFDVKADLMAALETCELAAASIPVSRDAPGWYHPGRSGTLRLGPTVLGWFGEIHPALLAELDVKGALCGFELFLDALPAARRKAGFAKPLLHLNPLQPVARDFAFIVDEKIESEAIVKAARAADKKLVQGAEVFDIYTGTGVEPGKKSVAVAVTLQPEGQTLTDAEIEAVAAKIVESVSGKTGGRLRG